MSRPTRASVRTRSGQDDLASARAEIVQLSFAAQAARAAVDAANTRAIVAEAAHQRLRHAVSELAAGRAPPAQDEKDADLDVIWGRLTRADKVVKRAEAVARAQRESDARAQRAERRAAVRDAMERMAISENLATAPEPECMEMSDAPDTEASDAPDTEMSDAPDTETSAASDMEMSHASNMEMSDASDMDSDDSSVRKASARTGRERATSTRRRAFLYSMEHTRRHILNLMAIQEQKYMEVSDTSGMDCNDSSVRKSTALTIMEDPKHTYTTLAKSETPLQLAINNARRWENIERSMERARDSRAQLNAKLDAASAGFQPRRELAALLAEASGTLDANGSSWDEMPTKNDQILPASDDVRQERAL